MNVYANRIFFLKIFFLFIIFISVHMGIYSYLKILEENNTAESFEAFVWAEKDIILKKMKLQDLYLKIDSPTQHFLKIQANGKNLKIINVPQGTSIVTYHLDNINPVQIKIESSYEFTPSNKIGSSDNRALSFKIAEVQINNKLFSLIDFKKNAVGVFEIEKNFNRILVNDVLTYTWDSMWYWRIATNGYSYNGNKLTQQNIAWPFLYPYCVKIYADLTDSNIQDSMLNINVIFLFAALTLLIFLGLDIGLNFFESLIAPAWLILNPFNIFLFAGFSEPMFLCLFFGSVIAIKNKQWALSAVLISLSCAVRLIGIISLLFLIYYYLIENVNNRNYEKYKSLLFLILISWLGIFVDILIKYYFTGFFISTFEIQAAWGTTYDYFYSEMKSFALIYSKEYFIFILISFSLIIISFTYAFTKFDKSDHFPSILIASGATICAGAWVLSPNFHAFGRYSLPLAASIVGIVSYGKKSKIVIPMILLLIIFGVSQISLFVRKFYLGLPPM